MFIGGYQVVFEGCFKNTNNGQIVSYFSNEVGHRFWLQSPLNHLNGEQRTNYIVVVLYQILELLHV
jgi:hypothetical protein